MPLSVQEEGRECATVTVVNVGRSCLHTGRLFIRKCQDLVDIVKAVWVDIPVARIRHNDHDYR